MRSRKANSKSFAATHKSPCWTGRSIVGEMSVLLDAPHTATVRALGEAKVRVAENAAASSRVQNCPGS